MVRPNHRRPQANSLSQGLDNAPFKALFWNAGGLSNDKFTELKNTILTDNIDIFGIVEAGAASENLEFFQLPGFQMYALPRARQVASGIIIAARSDIIVNFEIRKEQTDEDKLEAVRMDVWKGNLHKKFFVLYNPPRNKPDLTWLEQEWTRGSIMYGDLNAPSTWWGYSNTDPVGNIFEEFISSNPAEFIENESASPTFLSYSGNTSHPDVIVAHPSLSSSITHILLSPPGGFGHKVLVISIEARPGKPSEKRITKWNRKKADWRKFARLTDEILTEELIHHDNVDRSAKNIKEKLLECALKSVPRGSVKKYSPFWNSKLQKLKEERDDARKAVERNNDQQNRVQLKQKTSKMKKEIISAKRSTYRDFLEKLDFRKDGVRAHRFLSKINNRTENKNNPMKIGTSLITSESEIARRFCKYYSKISNYRPRKGNGKPPITTPQTCIREHDGQFLHDDLKHIELEWALARTNKGKSAGPDDLLPEFLLNLGPKAKCTILKFFNQVWRSQIPSDWRKAEVVPILKRGKSASILDNFRPIALTSVLSKLYERILTKRLQGYLETNELMCNNQAGFKKHRNTIEQVAHLSQEIKDGFQRKQSSLAVFVDLKTAFDRVWRQKLLQKLAGLGVSGHLYKSISSFLAQRFIKVRYRNSVSPYVQTKQGLPQGSVLSPVLFNIFIDDIIAYVESIPGTNALLYADDLALWATSSNIKSLESHLGQVLEVVKLWADENEMVVNSQKTEYQLFTLSTKHHDIQLKYNDEILTRTEQATYLGIKLDSKLHWNKHIQKQIEQATNRLNLMKRLTGSKWGATQDVLTLAYKSYVRPIIDYGSEIIITASDASLQKFDKIQNQALRLATGGAKTCPIAALELQTGVMPLGARREILAINMYEKLKRLNIDYWKRYRPGSERLKTQRNFSSVTEELIEKRNLSFSVREAFSVAEPQVDYLASAQLGLTQAASKNNTPSEVLKLLSLETICERYPISSWFHVYTDGSATASRENGGAGVYTAEFKISAPVGKTATNFEGEVRAILLALEVLIGKEYKKIVFFVDSLAAISALTSPLTSEVSDVTKSKEHISILKNRGSEVVMQWIPGHCGVPGNEEADKLAKEGSRMIQTENPLTLPSVKRIVKTAIKYELTEVYNSKATGKTWECLKNDSGQIPSDLPRGQFVACFRMLTGHDYLCKHLHRIGIATSPTCTLCSGPEMVAEHLDSCPALLDIRNSFTSDDGFHTQRSLLYWTARTRMAEVANVPRA